MSWCAGGVRVGRSRRCGPWLGGWSEGGRAVFGVVSLVCGVALSASAEPQADTTGGAQSVASALVFEGTTVIDVARGRLHPNQRVVVVGTRIQAVGPAKNVRVPSGARVVKAAGTYMIPGLWDMHVHPWGNEEILYPLFIANGVTGVRDMSMASLDSLREWRQRIAAGTQVGPRIVASGPAVYHPSVNKPSAPQWRGRTPWGVFPSTPEEGRRVIDSLKRAGADFIKLYDHHSREVYFAMMDEARRVGIPVAGHLSESVTAVEASAAGQRSIEHYLNCDVAAKPNENQTGVPDRARCRALAKVFRRHDTWFSVAMPTMASDPTITNWVTLQRYWPDSVLFWNRGATDYDSAMMAMTFQTSRQQFRSRQQHVRGRSTAAWAARHEGGGDVLGTMHRAGIRMLAGTDTGPTLFMMMAVPGFSLHTLLEAMVLDGLTPLQALQTATLNPAAYFDATDSLGTIAPGNVADLVLLDANPLADIYNTRRIRAVVANGRFFDRGELDVLLLEAEQRARGTR